MKKKWATMMAVTFGGGTLFHSCLGGFGGLGGGGGFGDFWEGFWGRGWPTDNLWINIGWDVLNEELFG